MKSKINLKVLVLDSDFYALQTVNSYLAWDRRTRVVHRTQSLVDALEFIHNSAEAEYPDVVLLDEASFAEESDFKAAILQFRQAVPDVVVVCLAHRDDPCLARAAQQAGAHGYVLRNEVRIHLVGAILHAMEHDFVITPSIQKSTALVDCQLFDAEVLPPQHEFPEMTDRIRQAIWLCVIEGMPAQLAADEMGISPHTIRSYIKEGYRILEAYDHGDEIQYPEDMGPLERAFMRFTALQDLDEDDAPKPQSGVPPAKNSEKDEPPHQRRDDEGNKRPK